MTTNQMLAYTKKFNQILGASQTHKNERLKKFLRQIKRELGTDSMITKVDPFAKKLTDAVEETIEHGGDQNGF